jgi:hypothetical protein
MSNLPNNCFWANFEEIYLAQFNEDTRQKTVAEMERELIQLNFPVEIIEETKKIGHYGFKKLAKKWTTEVIFQVRSAANSRWELVFEQTLSKQRHPGFSKDWIFRDLQLSKDVLLAKQILDFLSKESQKELCEKLLLRAIYHLFANVFNRSKISNHIKSNPQILVSESIESLMTLIVLTPWIRCYQIVKNERLQAFTR